MLVVVIQVQRQKQCTMDKRMEACLLQVEIAMTLMDGSHRRQEEVKYHHQQGC